MEKIYEMLKWIVGIAIGAAIGSVIGTRIVIWMFEKRSKKLVDTFITSVRKSPEVAGSVYKAKEILEFAYLFVKKMKKKEGLNTVGNGD